MVKAEPPLALAEIVGTVSELQLLEQVFAKPEIVDNPVATVMDPPLATIGTGEPVDMAVGARAGGQSCRGGPGCGPSDRHRYPLRSSGVRDGD